MWDFTVLYFQIICFYIFYAWFEFSILLNIGRWRQYAYTSVLNRDIYFEYSFWAVFKSSWEKVYLFTEVMFWKVIQNEIAIFCKIILCVKDVRMLVFVCCDCWHKHSEKKKITWIDLKHKMNSFLPHSPVFAVKEAEGPLLTSLNTEPVESEH